MRPTTKGKPVAENLDPQRRRNLPNYPTLWPGQLNTPMLVYGGSLERYACPRPSRSLHRVTWWQLLATMVFTTLLGVSFGGVLVITLL